MLKHTIVLIGLLGLCLPSAWAQPPSAEQLLRHLDQLYQQDSAYAVIQMQIVTPDFERSLRLESWSLGDDYALLRVLEPVREYGVSTLKRGQELWNYLPRVDRTVRIPAAMMMGSWMGSDFTNDDLLRETQWSEHYAATLNSDVSPWQLSLVPFAQTVTVWGRIEIMLDPEQWVPLEQRYYNERDELLRTLTFSEARTINGTLIPTRLRLEPAQKPEQWTQVDYEHLEFDVPLGPEFFTLQNLRR